uniref:Uncharacterized protein n=1 Tax=Romanomermis culicivorax TaxID=13658 RepID=A0A915KH82_ROMCU
MAKQWSDYGMNAFKQCLENYGGQRINSPAMTMTATPDGIEALPQLASRRGAGAFPFFASQWNNFSMGADEPKKSDGCIEGEDGRENETNMESSDQKNDDKESPKSMDSDSSDAAVNLTVNNHHGSSSSSSSGCQFSSSLEHKSTSSPLSSSSFSSSFGDNNSESQSIQKSSSDNKLSNENGSKKSSSTKSEESQKRKSSKDRMTNNNSQSSKKNIFPTPTSQIDLSNKNRSAPYDRPYVNFFLDNKSSGNDGNSTADGWAAQYRRRLGRGDGVAACGCQR